MEPLMDANERGFNRRAGCKEGRQFLSSPLPWPDLIMCAPWWSDLSKTHSNYPTPKTCAEGAFHLPTVTGDSPKRGPDFV